MMQGKWHGYWLLAGVLACGSASAQVQRSFINPSFEGPVLSAQVPASGCRVYINKSSVPGWETTHPNNTEENAGCVNPPIGTVPNSVSIIELWRGPRNSFYGPPVSAPDGAQFAELNATKPSMLYQNICLLAGESFQWGFSHRGRVSSTTPDQAEFVYDNGSSTTSTQVVAVATTNTGTGNITAGSGTAAQVSANATWVRYTGNYSHAGPAGVFRMGFNALSTAHQTDTSYGNFLDAVQLQFIKPLIEFEQAAYAAPEHLGNNLPRVRVTGLVTASITVPVSITGGTATAGADYTAGTLDVVIPPGNYDGTAATGSFFTVPNLVIHGDADLEADETIVLGMTGTASSAYIIGSIMGCGQAGNASTTYTILNDDITVTKAVGAVQRVPDPPTPPQYDVSYTVTVTGPASADSSVTATYSLSDTPGFEPDVAILTASFTDNGGPAQALAGTGPWTLATNQTIGVGQTRSYAVTTRVRVTVPDLGGNPFNDTCASPTRPGRGLHNQVTATVVTSGTGTGTLTASACANTPAPATLAPVPAVPWAPVAALLGAAAWWVRRRHIQG